MRRLRRHSIVFKGVLALIKLYQHTISPDHGAMPVSARFRCRFYPTCSSYAATCVARYGIMRGGWYALLRIARCHPWHPGGIDMLK